MIFQIIAWRINALIVATAAPIIEALALIATYFATELRNVLHCMILPLFALGFSINLIGTVATYNHWI